MELKDFISETLSQIVTGVVDAQTKVATAGKGGAINPYVHAPHDIKSTYAWTNSKEPVVLVDFDIAIAAEQGTDTKGGIGVVAGIFAFGSQGQSKENQQSTNKIKFSVPVMLPLHK
jgi:hypothetical protein